MTVLGLFGFAQEAHADSIRVSQESTAGTGDFDANVLGYVNTYTHAGTIADFYAYGVGDNASYNGDTESGGPGTANGLSQLFLVSASDGLFLVILHDDVNDGSGGTAVTKYVLSGDTGTIALKDDGGDGYTTSGGGTTFTANHRWVACCTDGYAIGGLDGDWSMVGGFTTSPTGLSTWQVTSNGGSNISLTLASGLRVRLDAVPEPGSIALLGLGLAGLALGARRRARRNAA